MMPNPFGTDIVTDINLVEPGEPYEVDRTWKERLFALPWRPLKKTNTVVPMVPSKAVYGVGNKMVMHPETLEALKKEVNWGENK